MKKIIRLLFIVAALPSFSQNIDSIAANNAYKAGEVLVYAVKYGLVQGGQATMKIDIIPSGSDFYYYVKAEAVTTGLATSFAKIYDVYESYINITTGYPVKSVRNITENHYTNYNEVLFFRDSGYVVSLTTGKHKVPKNTLDLLSAFYFARRQIYRHNFSKGEVIKLTTFFDNQLYPVAIKFLKKETIKTKFGKIPCLLFVPILTKDNPFKKEDDLRIWFSDDGNFIPVKIKMKSKVGTVKAVLIDFKNLKNPLGVKH